MIEGRISSHLPRQEFSGEQAQGQRRDYRTEDVASNSHQAVGNRHRPESRESKNNDGRNRQYRQRQNDDAALGTGFIDRRADRGLDGEPEQAADRGYHSDIGLTPMLLGNQEDVEIRADRAAHVGREKIDGVE
jgi:hypothetical protein